MPRVPQARNDQAIPSQMRFASSKMLTGEIEEDMGDRQRGRCRETGRTPPESGGIAPPPFPNPPAGGGVGVATREAP